MHIYTYIYIHMSKYNMLSLYNVTCMCIFMDDYLALDRQLMCSSLGKITSHSKMSSITYGSVCRVEVSWNLPASTLACCCSVDV